MVSIPEGASTLITLADVARLAGVKRPVVSMWRTRLAESDDPFPPALEARGRVAYFDAEAVASWLERTGHGNNKNACADVAAFSAPSPRTSSDIAQDAYSVTALLALKATTGVALSALSESELFDLVELTDPHDVLLAREVRRLSGDIAVVARHVDRLADAAYTVQAAFEQVMDDRFRRQLRGHTAAALHPRARQLVAGIAQGLAQTLDGDTPVFVDSAHGGGDLLLAVAALYADGPAPSFITCDDDSDVCRLARRRLRVHDLHRDDLVLDEDDSFEVTGAAVHVAQFPPPACPGMTDLEVLSAIDNVVLQMDEQQRAVIVAPARLLADALRASDCERIRDDLLRTDKVKAILRLPKGLLISASRQPLALWILGPADPEVSSADRWTMVGDLSELALLPTAIQDVIGDVIAATEGYRLARTHAFRYLRPAPTHALRAQRRSLVRQGIPVSPVDDVTPGDVIVRVEALVDNLDLRHEAIGELVAAEPPAPDAPKLGARPLGDLIHQRQVTVHPGNRLSERSIGAESGHVVIGPSELVGTSVWGSRTVDRLTFAAENPAGRLTQPGDVIFCTSPKVAAQVDLEGGSVVQAPARVLRPSGNVVAHVLARDINAVQPRSTAWRLWPVRITPAAHSERLTEVLTAIDDERQAAQRRLASLQQLADLVTDGVTAGVIALPNQTHSQPIEAASQTDAALSARGKEGK